MSKPTKLRGCENMLIDIYDEEIYKSPIVAEIYSELNANATLKMKSINVSDRPVLVYTALMYDKNSPIRRQQLENRKLIAVEQAMFRNEREAIAAMEISSDRVVAIIHYYLRFQSDFLWSAYCTTAESFWGNQQMILRGANDAKEQETVMKLQERMPKMIESLAMYEAKIFGDNTVKVKEIINFSVEDFALALENAEAEKNL